MDSTWYSARGCKNCKINTCLADKVNGKIGKWPIKWVSISAQELKINKYNKSLDQFEQVTIWTNSDQFEQALANLKNIRQV